MKTFTIDIHPELCGVEVTVRNGREFQESITKGRYHNFEVEMSERDRKRVKQFAVHHADDYGSNYGNWYAHCNGYAMDLCVTLAGKRITINTYRPYGRSER